MAIVQRSLFAGDGEMADLMRARDWAATSLGPASDWPAALLTTVNLALESPCPMLVLWGPEFLQFFNDAFRPLLGSAGLPEALGAPAPGTWTDALATIGPLLRGVRETGCAIRDDAFRIAIERESRLVETHVAFSASPIRDGAGVGGVLVIGDETAALGAGDRRTIDAELRLRAGLLDQADDAIFAWSLDGAIVYWNKGAERLYGYAAHEAIGRISHELLQTEHPGGREAFLRALQTDETIEGELTQTRRDGTRVTVATRHQPIRAGDRLLVLEANRDISERKAIEAARRANEARQAFLLALSDALRPLEDPLAVQRAATRLVGERLGVDRVLYAETTPDQEYLEVGDNYVRDGYPMLTGRLPAGVFGAATELLRVGTTLVIPDVDAAALDDAAKANIRAAGVRAAIAVPLVKNGRWAATLGVHHGAPRDWTPDETRLLEDVAERTWDAVERARAEQALRASEARLTRELADAEALQSISSQLIQEDDIDLLYEQILDAATGMLRADFGSMQMLVPERTELLLLAEKGFSPEAAAFWTWVRAGSASSCGVALAAGERVIVPDIETCAFLAGTDQLEHYRRAGIRAMQSTPLVSRDGRIVGMISTHWRDAHAPSERELRLLDVLARQAADLIERRRADDALRESERRLQRLADAMPQIVWISAADGGTVLYLNDRWFAYTGQSPDEPHDRSSEAMAAAIHPDDRAHAAERWRAALETGTVFEDEVRLREASGRYCWFLSRCAPMRDDAGRIAQWFGTSTDITALKEAEAIVRRSEERLQRAIDIETVGVIYVRTDGAVTYANDAFLRMSGYDRDDVARGLVRWDAMTPPEWLPQTLEIFQGFSASGRIAPYEKEYIRKDGSRWWALFAGTRLEGDEGVEFVLDVTEAKRMEAAHQAIIDAVAHDVKNPLTAVVGQAQLISRRLTRGESDFDRLKTSVEAIAAGATRAADLLDDLTDAARLGAGQLLTLQRAPVDLVALAETAAAQQQIATERHTIRVEPAVVSLVGEWDAARIRRVLDNLLSNAVKYSPNGGPVTVTVGREETPDGAWAVLTVADRGVGIPSGDVPRVFERFHRGGNVARRIAGSGIGLSGARQIIEQHGGTIAVTSADGQGSAFTVRLPLANET